MLKKILGLLAFFIAAPTLVFADRGITMMDENGNVISSDWNMMSMMGVGQGGMFGTFGWIWMILSLVIAILLIILLIVLIIHFTKK